MSTRLSDLPGGGMHAEGASKTARWALRIAFLVAIPALVGVGMNACAIQQSNQTRHESRVRFAEADYRLCRGLNRITLRDRASILNSTKGTRALLELLGFPKKTIDKFVAASKRNAQREIRRRPLLMCHRLPSQ